MAGVIVLYQKTDRAKKLNFMLWPAMDALKNDFSASPSIILSRLSAQPVNEKRISGFHIRNNFSLLMTFFTPVRFRRVAG
jgi:hypothetical protein